MWMKRETTLSLLLERWKAGKGGEGEGGLVMRNTGRGGYKEWKTRELRQAMMAHATDPYAKQ